MKPIGQMSSVELRDEVAGWRRLHFDDPAPICAPAGRTLQSFIEANSPEILQRARARVQARNSPISPSEDGLPVFLLQLVDALRRVTARELLDHGEIEISAIHHGGDLFQQGLTIDQVVHDYGDLCQVISGLAVDRRASIAAEEFRTLNLCLDDAIAGAVTEWSRLHSKKIIDDGTERLGVLAHEIRNLLNVAAMSFSIIKKGRVAPGGGCT